MKITNDTLTTDHKEALKAVREGKVVHVYNTAEPHINDGIEVCWCSPRVEQYDTGGVLIIHKQVVWH